MPIAASKDPATSKGYLLIHFCVLLFGFTPLMGRLITIDALSLVWWRMLIASLALLLLPMTWRGIRKMSLRLFALCCVAGIVLAITWMLFYLSVKLTNASVAAICLATAPMFVAISGPVIQRKQWQKSDLMLAAAVIPGIMLVVGGIPHTMYLGFIIGLISAATLVVFSGINKLIANQTSPLSATSVEMGMGAIFTALVISILPDTISTITLPDWHNSLLLIIFGIILTAVPVALTLLSLRYITVFAQQMAVNLEPVYAVILAIPILGEQRQLNPLFYLGVALIIGMVMLEPLLSRIRKTNVK